MSQSLHPNQDETEFLNLSFNRFIDVFTEIMTEEFWKQNPDYRFSKSKDLFAVYSEILKYPPVQWVIDANRRPNHSDVGRDLFKLIRHILTHFPYFEKWDDVWIRQSIVNLYSTRQQYIDKFLSENEDKEDLKYRFWEEESKKMTYVSVTFPQDYSKGEKIFLREMLLEKEGVKFAAIFMWDIIKIQIEEIKNT